MQLPYFFPREGTRGEGNKAAALEAIHLQATVPVNFFCWVETQERKLPAAKGQILMFCWKIVGTNKSKLRNNKCATSFLWTRLEVEFGLDLAAGCPAARLSRAGVSQFPMLSEFPFFVVLHAISYNNCFYTNDHTPCLKTCNSTSL